MRALVVFDECKVKFQHLRLGYRYVPHKPQLAKVFASTQLSKTGGHLVLYMYIYIHMYRCHISPLSTPIMFQWYYHYGPIWSHYIPIMFLIIIVYSIKYCNYPTEYHIKFHHFPIINNKYAIIIISYHFLINILLNNIKFHQIQINTPLNTPKFHQCPIFVNTPLNPINVHQFH